LLNSFKISCVLVVSSVLICVENIFTPKVMVQRICENGSYKENAEQFVGSENFWSMNNENAYQVKEYLNSLYQDQY
jgi:hypothetical protein